MTPANSGEVAECLYHEHEDWLRDYAVGRVPGREISHAEDVVQETFVRVIKHLNKGKKIDSPEGFLYTTASNLITSMFYRGRKHTAIEWEPDMDVYAVPATVCSPEHLTIARENLEVLSFAIDTLPQRYREAFIRRRIRGESCSEIGMEMQLSESAVSNYAALGWKQLVEYFVQHDIVLDDFSNKE
ncbi:MAG: RNA polymerase sigma factor [Pseudomonadota bacterium]